MGQGQKYTEIEKKVIRWVGGMISVVRWQFLQEFAKSLLPGLAPDFLLTEKLLRRARGQKEQIGIFWSFCLLGLKFQEEDSHAGYLQTSGT